ncbi:MAG: bleomycin resistance protein [Roseibacillus sp.]|jgi:catechol 2,3-dioxygenase-like lactoylglutathione lyase family enzyme|nr:bleomycin resistance protein [Roseibacillus sp.]MBP35681.1 bleomycin resistance protein [Roseibacillus sp.]MCP4728954.1 VOC family protein [Roseibacillus sp.]MDP6208356.1 VOC family protein [Roseibacillus sp.]MDP7107239.1 VOC family protein [Roseibacillus sp.]|tara:strand:- start:6610 stop:7164 length:555 start_codon:yes stop_codon:yes gene_type:complete
MQRTTALALASFLSLITVASAQEGKKAQDGLYAKGVIDLGIVVRDLDRSAKFYTEVLGLQEVKGFKVPGKVTGDFGLTDNQDVTARVFVAVDASGKPSTKLKMMAFPKAQGAAPDQKYIHSTLGVSYLTLFVTDMDAMMARLKKAGVKTLGKTPAPIGGANHLTVFRDPDGNFIELIGPSGEGR